MEAVSKVDLETRVEQRQIEAAQYTWQLFVRTADTGNTVQATNSTQMGNAQTDAAAHKEDYRRNARAEYKVDQETGEVIVRIIDEESGETICSIPPDVLMEDLRSGEEWTHRWRIYV